MEGVAVNLKALRQRCEGLLQDVDVPDPFDVHAFADSVSRRRGRPVRLLAKHSPVGPCGVWVALPTIDWVFYEDGTSRMHRDHIIVHELAHLLAAHEPTEQLEPGLLAGLLAGLLPDLDLSMVKRVLSRSSYSAVEEQEAEMIATLVMQRAGQPASTKSSESDRPKDADVLARLDATLGGARNEHRGR